MSPPKPIEGRDYLFHFREIVGSIPIQTNLCDLVAEDAQWPANILDYRQLIVNGNKTQAKYRHLQGKGDAGQRCLPKCIRCINRRKQSQKQTKNGQRQHACQNVTNKVRIALVAQVQEQPADTTDKAEFLNRWDDELKSQNTNPPLAFINNYHWMIRLLFASLNLKEGRMACRTCTIIN
uniref:Nicastrin n=1 Tax=Phallusia mammillata TaxID=59560 RepID=A0A6F9DLC1_9ASCI|nr:nicastrin [Phallusia mammillata]